MPKQISSPAASTAAIETRTRSKEEEETLKSKFELTESNLKRWFLGPIEKEKSIVEDACRQMIQEGVSEKLAKDYTYWHVHPEEKRARNVLKLVINEKTGKLWDILTLQQAGKLSDVQIDQIITEHK